MDLLLRARFASGVAVAVVGLAAAGLVPACTTGAVGVDACRQIESARCDAVPACEGDDPSFGISTEVQIRNCKVYYNDFCLVGLENAKNEPIQDDVDDCSAAIGVVAACQRDNIDILVECLRIAEEPEERVAFVLAEFADISPCEALRFPERLSDCAFIAKPDDDE